MTFEALIIELEKLGIEVDENKRDNLLTYKHLIQTVNQVLNLTAIDDDEGIYLKHYYDSMLINPLIKKGSFVCDIGSGAGFPGLVLAILRPDITISCVEPTLKRCNFLNQVIQACHLSNVTVYNERAEDFVKKHRELFDVCTARAVAYLDILSELCLPLVKVGGLFIAMKGASGEQEYAVSQKAITLCGGELKAVHKEFNETLGTRINLEILKMCKTPPQYPRTYGKIKRAPLSGRKYE
ncbi:16S rRNA (guanine(527)-N(7))-methyltransferase RsmG [Erysipelothrix larvae]|uniref:Ribosomal RNA small subunit methyltransferase G n=1 Tax=Erysipelothrix larvae TaxID=1514105 RepID=A0A120JU11_9FIRM|nr:16S rRNA (guanine(527)-N(7))-methyltransferase RsmG [Erysipelothrix larvae]AMC94545.1 16S rRNA (guanine(527)-N(7))-methyltransferase RsmG [Erysipelothrix larvae]